jgi:hypothetical protein
VQGDRGVSKYVFKRTTFEFHSVPNFHPPISTGSLVFAFHELVAEHPVQGFQAWPNARARRGVALRDVVGDRDAGHRIRVHLERAILFDGKTSEENVLPSELLVVFCVIHGVIIGSDVADHVHVVYRRGRVEMQVDPLRVSDRASDVDALAREIRESDAQIFSGRLARFVAVVSVAIKGHGILDGLSARFRRNSVLHHLVRAHERRLRRRILLLVRDEFYFHVEHRQVLDACVDDGLFAFGFDQTGFDVFRIHVARYVSVNLLHIADIRRMYKY